MTLWVGHLQIFPLHPMMVDRRLFSILPDTFSDENFVKRFLFVTWLSVASTVINTLRP